MSTEDEEAEKVFKKHFEELDLKTLFDSALEPLFNLSMGYIPNVGKDQADFKTEWDDEVNNLRSKI